MSTRSYRGNRGKNIYEINNFNKGVHNTNSSINNGQVKELFNFKISPDGMSLRPRDPFINYSLHTVGEDGVISLVELSPEIGIFTSKQYPNKEFIIDLKGQRPNKSFTIPETEKQNIHVIDGDTIRYEGQRYRLLLINAPELDEDGGEEAKEHLQDLINSAGDITVIYDPQAPSWVDAFGRHLVWLYIGQNNLNQIMVQDKHAVLSDKTITAHMYDIRDWVLVGDDADVVIDPYPGHNITVYERQLNKEPVLLKTENNKYEIYNGAPEGNIYRPSYEVKYFENIYLGALSNDLELGYSYVPNFDVKTTTTEKDHFKTNYYPFIVNEMPNHDGMVLLGNVKTEDNDKLVYHGLLTVDLEIPFTSDDSRPDFANPKIIINSYKNNVRKVAFEDLRSHSQNLLDKDTIELQSYFGQNAIDEGYKYPEIRSILFRDENGDYYSQLKRNTHYDVVPLLSVPNFVEEVNGYDPNEYVSYAYKWEIIKHNNGTADSKEELIEEIPWTSIQTDRKYYVEPSMFQNLSDEINILHYRNINPIEFNVGSSKKLRIYWSKTPTTVYPYDEIVFYDVNHNPTGSINHSNGLVFGSKYYDIPENSYYFDINITLYPNDAEMELGTEFLESVIHSYIRNLTIEGLYESSSMEKYYPEYLNTSQPYFKDSSLGVQVRLFVAPAKLKEGTDGEWTEEQLAEMDLNAEIMTSAHMPYQSEDFKLPSLVNTSTIEESKYITFFEDMLVMYGGNTHGNIIYLSDFGNPSYFPVKYALDQIPEEIVHIHTFKDIMVVFTKSDIWAIEKWEIESESEPPRPPTITTEFRAKKILQNVYIDAHLKSSIRTVGKQIMIMLEDRIIFLRPNTFTGDNTDLSFLEVSTPIGNIIKNPTEFVRNRLRYYNIFTDEDLKFDLSSEVDNRDFKIMLSTYINGDYKTPYLLEILFEGTKGIWTFKDTLSTAYPIFFSKGLRYFKSHPSFKGGVVISESNGSNIYKMLDPKKAHMDIHNFEYHENSITTLSDEYLSRPINTLVDLGYMNISNHLSKRFHEARMEITNINTSKIDMAYSFTTDNQQQQSTYEVFMSVKEGYLDEEEVITFDKLEEIKEMDFKEMDFEEIEEINITEFDNFKLDLSRFPTANKLDLRIPVNGRGRVPRLILAFNTTNDFEIFRFMIIYKEQTGRMVRQK